MAATTGANKILRFATILIAIIFVLLPFHALLTVWSGNGLHLYTAARLWDEGVLSIAVVAILFLIVRYGGYKLSGHRARLLWWACLAYISLHVLLGLVALLRRQVNLTALGDGLLLDLRFLVFFWLCAVVASQKKWLHKHWQQLVIWPALLVIVFGLLQHFVLPADFLKHFGYGPHTIQPVETVDQKLAYVRIQSTLRGANPLGAYLVLTVAAITVIGLRVKKQRWLMSLTGIAAGVVLFFTYSRSAWAGALAAVLVVCWLISKKIRPWLLASLILLFVTGAGGVFALRHNSRIDNIFFHTDQHSRSSTSSNQGHVGALENGLRDIARQPLGEGPGTAGPASVHNKLPPRMAENYFIQLGQEVGVVGVVLFTVIIFLLGEILYHHVNDSLDVTLLASLIGISVVCLLSPAWADDTLAFIWWGLAGIAAAPVIIKTSSHETQTQKKTAI